MMIEGLLKETKGANKDDQGATDLPKDKYIGKMFLTKVILTTDN